MMQNPFLDGAISQNNCAEELKLDNSIASCLIPLRFAEELEFLYGVGFNFLVKVQLQQFLRKDMFIFSGLGRMCRLC